MKDVRLIGLAILAWAAPILVLPLFFLAWLNAGMSAGIPTISFRDALILGGAPLISVVIFGLMILWSWRGRLKWWVLLLQLIPTLLSLAELVFTYLLWAGG
jgi:hypothetical protein